MHTLPNPVPPCPALRARPRRRLALAGAAAAVAAAAASLIAGCASLAGPRQVHISKDELLSKLARQFPMRRQLAEVFEVEANTPRLDLFPDTNRVAADFDLMGRDRIFGRTYQGSIGLSFGLRYEGTDHTIRLSNVKVDKVNLQGLPQLAQQQLSRLGAWVAEERLQNYPIHQFKPEDLRTADRWGYQVRDIRVTATGLAVDLEAKR